MHLNFSAACHALIREHAFSNRARRQSFSLEIPHDLETAQRARALSKSAEAGRDGTQGSSPRASRLQPPRGMWTRPRLLSRRLQ